MSQNLDKGTARSLMPEGDELRAQIAQRHRRGSVGLALFQFALVIAIVVLTALIFNIINQTFGLVAIENVVEPKRLVTETFDAMLVSTPNTSSGENDELLARDIAADPNAIGFFGYAFYQEYANELNLVAVDGILPGAETASSGEYPLARPLYIYTGEEILVEQPEVAAFIDFYLDNVNDQVDRVGYFPATEATLTEQKALLRSFVDVKDVSDGEVLTAGSSTVHPLTIQLAREFKRSGGFGGKLKVDRSGSTAGITSLCESGTVDIANASRAMNAAEAATCTENIGRPIEFQVGVDAIAVVVSRENTFLQNASSEQLQQIFTSAESWSDVDPSWPDATITRHIPGTESGTLDLFVAHIFGAQPLADLPGEMLIEALNRNVSAGVMRRYESELPLAERTQENLYNLVLERVIQPTTKASWNLIPSLFARNRIETEAREMYPNAEVRFQSWLNRPFLDNTQSSVPAAAGIRTAILGSLWVILITFLFAVPIGVGAAIYLEEYATHGRINRILQTNIDNLAGVPSIIYRYSWVGDLCAHFRAIHQRQISGRSRCNNGQWTYDRLGRADTRTTRAADHHHQRAGGDPSGPLLAARCGVWAGCNQVAGGLDPCATQRATRYSDRHDPGHVTCSRRDRTADRNRGIDLYHRRSQRPLFQIYRPTDADLPVDHPAPG